MTETIFLPLLTFLLGLLFGHRLSLWREKRKEFNEVAVRILVAIESRARDPRPYFSTAGKIDGRDLAVFENLLHPWSRVSFKASWKKYEEECQNTTQDIVGQISYANPSAVSGLLEKVGKFTKLR